MTTVPEESFAILPLLVKEPRRTLAISECLASSLPVLSLLSLVNSYCGCGDRAHGIPSDHAERKVLLHTFFMDIMKSFEHLCQSIPGDHQRLLICELPMRSGAVIRLMMYLLQDSFSLPKPYEPPDSMDAPSFRTILSTSDVPDEQISPVLLHRTKKGRKRKRRDSVYLQQQRLQTVLNHLDAQIPCNHTLWNVYTQRSFDGMLIHLEQLIQQCDDCSFSCLFKKV